MMMPAWPLLVLNSLEERHSRHTWIMNRMIGLEGLYCEGFEPSRMPPWAGALAVLVAVAVVTVVVTKSVTVRVVVAILRDVCPGLLSAPKVLRCFKTC